MNVAIVFAFEQTSAPRVAASESRHILVVHFVNVSFQVRFLGKLLQALRTNENAHLVEWFVNGFFSNSRHNYVWRVITELSLLFHVAAGLQSHR